MALHLIEIIDSVIDSPMWPVQCCKTLSFNYDLLLNVSPRLRSTRDKTCRPKRFRISCRPTWVMPRLAIKIATYPPARKATFREPRQAPRYESSFTPFETFASEAAACLRRPLMSIPRASTLLLHFVITDVPSSDIQPSSLKRTRSDNATSPAM